MKLTIDRARWLRGEGGHDSYLLRERDQKMCCIGQLAQACGVSEDALAGERNLFAIGKHESKAVNLSLRPYRYNPDSPNSTAFCDHRAITKAYNINDQDGITEKGREEELTKILAEMGVEVTFIN